ncbi:MAG: hypothetical protein OHK0029_06610 [Armatimonadaceae bacterium]
MSLLIFLGAYAAVCVGGRLLLRRVRQIDLLFQHLRGSQGITGIGAGITGGFSVLLLTVSLVLAATHFAQAQAGEVAAGVGGLPGLWWTVLGGSVLLTLLLLLLHYNDSDWVQFGVFCLVALMLLGGMTAVYELDTPYTGLYRIPLPEPY